MIQIRNLEHNDIDEIIKIHLESFDKSHFTSHFSAKKLYAYFSILLRNNPFSYVVVMDTKIMGYILGGVDPLVGVNKFLRKNILYIIWLLIKHPDFLKEKLVEKIYKRKSSSIQFNNEPVIYIIATNPSFKLGFGKKLLNHFEKNIIQKDYCRYHLSVRKDNQEAINFYEKNGFILYQENKISFGYYKKIK